MHKRQAHVCNLHMMVWNDFISLHFQLKQARSEHFTLLLLLLFYSADVLL